MNAADADLLTKISDGIGQPWPKRIGVAVSGGGDSTALLSLLHSASKGQDAKLFAASVDHGLRAGARDEAKRAGTRAAALGISHEILDWRGWDGQGNLQARARAARYSLLADWARENDIPVVALGHTLDDQAETVLMRLSRSAGVDGLAGMSARRVDRGVTFVRPLLTVRRDALRTYLTRQGLDWDEDPSNQDPQFDRIKVRALADQLQSAGLSPEALGTVAQNMQDAKAALNWQVARLADVACNVVDGDIVIQMAHLRDVPEDILRRLMLSAVTWVARLDYPPRRRAVLDAITDVQAGKSASLGGCLLVQRKGQLHICREYKAVQQLSCAFGEIWDGRWRMFGPESQAPLIQRALGEDGLADCPDWRDTGRPRESLLASPSLWNTDKLLSAPLAGQAGNYVAQCLATAEQFKESILSH